MAQHEVDSKLMRVGYIIVITLVIIAIVGYVVIRLLERGLKS